jgi:ribosome maturation factor RimP
MRESQIASLLAPVLTPFGLELETVEVVPAGKRRLLRVVVDGDGPDGRGPLLDDIAAATKAISLALDDAPETGNAPYTLEVSSRGISRPLEQPRHWRRNRGRLVAVTTTDDQAVLGRVLSSDEQSVLLDIDGTERRFALADIGKALVQVEFNRPSNADIAGGGAGDGDGVDEEDDEARED